MKKLLLLVTIFLLQTAIASATQLTFGYLDNNLLIQSGPLWNKELNPIPSDEAAFQLQGNTGQFDTLLDPVKLFIGVANADATFAAPTITSILRSDGTTFTPGSPVQASFVNSLTSSSADAYTLAGLSGLNDSQNWTNWSGAYDAILNPLTASFFGIFVYNLNNTLLDPQKLPVGFELSGDLPAGTYLFGAAQFAKYDKDGEFDGSKWYGTAFTESGMTDGTVPEPGTIVLLGAGLFALGIFSRRRLNK